MKNMNWMMANAFVYTHTKWMDRIDFPGSSAGFEMVSVNGRRRRSQI